MPFGAVSRLGWLEGKSSLALIVRLCSRNEQVFAFCSQRILQKLYGQICIPGLKFFKAAVFWSRIHSNYGRQLGNIGKRCSCFKKLQIGATFRLFYIMKSLNGTISEALHTPTYFGALSPDNSRCSTGVFLTYQNISSNKHLWWVIWTQMTGPICCGYRIPSLIEQRLRGRNIYLGTCIYISNFHVISIWPVLSFQKVEYLGHPAFSLICVSLIFPCQCWF